MSDNLIDSIVGERTSESIPERPSWLPDKFKTPEDLAKSYGELEKKVGVVPDEYDISNSIFINPEYDPIKDFLSTAKEKRVPKEVVDKFVESMDKYLGEFDIDMSIEAAKLGDNAKERLTTLDNWAKANLSNNSYKALINNLQSADAIQALEELRGKMMSNFTQVPSGNESATTSVETIESIKQEIINNYDKYKSDEKYRKDIEGRLTLSAKAAGLLDKHGS